MIKNEDDISDPERLKELIDEVNRRALRDELLPHEVLQIKMMLPQLEAALRAYDRVKWIARMTAAGIPILLALWQLLDRMHLW